jgi:hypothetical protein
VKDSLQIEITDSARVVAWLVLMVLGWFAASLRVTAIIHELGHTVAGWSVWNPAIPTGWVTTGFARKAGGWESITGYLSEVFFWMVIWKRSGPFGMGVAGYAVVEFPHSYDTMDFGHNNHNRETAIGMFYVLVIFCVIANIIWRVNGKRGGRSKSGSRVSQRPGRRVLLEKQQGRARPHPIRRT